MTDNKVSEQLAEQRAANHDKFSSLQRLHNFTGFPAYEIWQARIDVLQQFVLQELGGDAGDRFELAWEEAFAGVLEAVSKDLLKSKLQLPGQLNLDGKEVR